MRRLGVMFGAVCLAAFGPFVWNDRDVEAARELIVAGKYTEAVEALKGTDADAAEVHLARAIALLAQEKADQQEAVTSSLDQAYRLIAEAGAMLAGHDAETEAKRAHLNDLRRRVAFARGLLATQKQDWAAAVGEFRRVLELDPADDDARWNLEVAYFKLHPPCKLRDDDHEEDDTAGDAKPYDPQKAPPSPGGGGGGGGGPKRLLCAADDDWYTLELPAETLLQIEVKGKITPTEDDDDTRAPVLSLFSPADPANAFKTVELKGGSGMLGVRRLPQAGTWKLQLTGPGRAEVAYDLQIAAVPPCPAADDDAEENDDAAHATAVQDGERPNLKACPGDADWYQISVPAKEGRTVTVKHNAEDGPLIAEVVTPDGIPLAPGGPGVTLPATEEAQQYLVRVSTVTEAENLYTLVVKKSEGGDDQDKNEDQKDQDQKDQGDQDQKNQDQKNQDQKDQKDDQAQQQPPPQPQVMNQVDPQKLIDELDKNKENPQLQKLLRNLSAVPQMEDY